LKTAIYISNNTSYIDYDEYLNLWNDFATRNKKSKIVKLTNTRKKQIVNRLKDYKNFLEIFKYVLIKAEKTNILLEGSFFDFDWIYFRTVLADNVGPAKGDGQQPK
jgi:hypothetical protein